MRRIGWGGIQAAARRQMRQAQAAVQLGLSARQVKRLVRRYRERGTADLVSARRGKCPANAIAEAVRERAPVPVSERYPDFSPTLAHEKLTQCHGFSFCAQTLRRWMRDAGLWSGRRRKRARSHPRRQRRWHPGELVRIDGSRHDRFEERGPQCVPSAFVDDAASRLLALRFAPAETTQAYQASERTVRQPRVPVAGARERLSSARCGRDRPRVFDGGVKLLYRGRELPYRLWREGEPPVPVRDGNELAYSRSGRAASRPRTIPGGAGIGRRQAPRPPPERQRAGPSSAGKGHAVSVPQPPVKARRRALSS